ncbi:DoxX family protein [Streptomyces sp. NPDC050560]|uniref:DoxX family protein n=1 Tax=Streptomyces sp. NPDC050560 TaxID=3365630 RepID=UPI003797CE60
MSVDTRTPRTPTGERPSGFDDVPALSMVKVPSDPAQVIVNHASFRVRLPAAGQPLSARVGARPPAGRRRAPVVWSGRSAPGDPGATGLLQAVRTTGVRHSAESGDPGATQVIPRIDAGTPPPPGTAPGGGTRLLPKMRTAVGAYDPPEGADEAAGEPYDDGYDTQEVAQVGGPHDGREREGGRRRDGVRHAYYPGRRMNLGVVLLPLRVFLGLISVYAGMGKLCDPVYFDGGQRGSMVKWLNSLHPWALATPLKDFALQHPVGAGLTIAFLQVIVGVLTILGLWQRVAAVIGALLSAALILTVSWKSVPVYDAPDIIYLAAWSPLVIAGAPVYSADGRLISEAWRTLGPRAELWELRRRVLRRGALIAGLVVGLTFLAGAVLGGAVRDADRVTVPGPGEAPHNQLPGSPLPRESGKRHGGSGNSPSASSSPDVGRSADPTASDTPSADSTAGATAGTDAGAPPAATQGTEGQPPPAQQAPPGAPAATSGPSSTGGGGAPPSSGGTGGGTSTGGPTGGTSSSGGGGSDESGSLVGGLLG